jgi:hypothetical protein
MNHPFRNNSAIQSDSSSCSSSLPTDVTWKSMPCFSCHIMFPVSKSSWALEQPGPQTLMNARPLSIRASAIFDNLLLFFFVKSAAIVKEKYFDGKARSVISLSPLIWSEKTGKLTLSVVSCLFIYSPNVLAQVRALVDGVGLALQGP